jgi:hypothetical protein
MSDEPLDKKLEKQLADAKAKEALAANDKLREGLKEQLATLKEITAEQERLIKLDDQANVAKEKANRLESQILAQTELLNKAKLQLIRKDEELIRNLENQIAMAQAGIEVQNENLEKIEQQGYSQENLTAAAREQQSALEKLKTEAKNINVEFVNLESTIEDSEEAADGLGNVLNSAFGGSTGIIGDAVRQAKSIKESFGTAGVEIVKSLGSGSPKKLTNLYGLLSGTVDKVGEGLVKIAKTPVGGLVAPVLIGLVILKYAQLAFQIDNLSRALGASTGFGNKFNDQITKMGVSGNMAGVGFEESAAALTALTQGLSSFNPTAEKTNIHVGLTVAKLEKLGVTSAASVKSIDNLEKTMGMTSIQAADTTAMIARMGKEIGVTGTKMVENFNSSFSRMAVFGSKNMKVFKELTAAFKASGIEMSKLISMSEKYDTFSGAAEQVSQLNAVLGTNLSTLEMINATDSERIMIIKQQVQQSVGNFDNLDKYTKMYVAQAMGVTDVAEAQRLLNMSTAEYNKHTKGQQESADIQKELSEATREAVPLFNQLKLAFMQLFLVLRPVIDYFTGLLEGIGAIMAAIGPYVEGMGNMDLVTGKLSATVGAFTVGLALLRLGFFAFTGPLGAVVFGLTSLFAILHKSGSPMLYKMPEVLSGFFHMLGESLVAPVHLLSGLADGFISFYDSIHPSEKPMNFDIAALANIDMSKITEGINQVRSAMEELSTIETSGFVALTTDGTNTSMVMASEGIIKNLSEGRLTVDVNMPEIKMPEIKIELVVQDAELKKLIDTRQAENSTKS